MCTFHKHFGKLDRKKYSQDVFKAKSFNFKEKQSRQLSLSSLLSFFSLDGELGMGHAPSCVYKCVRSPIILWQLPSTVPQHHSTLVVKFLGICGSPLSFYAPKILLTTFLWNHSHIWFGVKQNSNSKMVSMDMDLLGFSVCWLKLFKKKPHQGAYHLIYLSALLGHIKVAPFELCNCI